MMKLRVIPHGTLGGRFLNLEPGQGMKVEIPVGGTVKNLLAILGIPEKVKAVVVVEGRVLKENDTMPPGSSASIFEPIHGG
ncbi:MAG: hypothetical protein JW836_15920 [Deltaproteobacteria bacterium]|nr:hypothetical protein [Deltaproteobacteria bacterium]